MKLWVKNWRDTFQESTPEEIIRSTCRDDETPQVLGRLVSVLMDKGLLKVEDLEKITYDTIYTEEQARKNGVI